jgi:hypothetical protein
MRMYCNSKTTPPWDHISMMNDRIPVLMALCQVLQVHIEAEFQIISLSNYNIVKRIRYFAQDQTYCRQPQAYIGQGYGAPNIPHCASEKSGGTGPQIVTSDRILFFARRRARHLYTSWLQPFCPPGVWNFVFPDYGK